MKVDRKTYKGIEYIQIQDLPVVQQEKLLETFNRDLFIKIMIDGKITGQCLQYKDYCNWFDNVYAISANRAPVSAEQDAIIVQPNLALNKA